MPVVPKPLLSSHHAHRWALRCLRLRSFFLIKKSDSDAQVTRVATVTSQVDFPGATTNTREIGIRTFSLPSESQLYPPGTVTERARVASQVGTTGRSADCNRSAIHFFLKHLFFLILFESVQVLYPSQYSGQNLPNKYNKVQFAVFACSSASVIMSSSPVPDGRNQAFPRVGCGNGISYVDPPSRVSIGGYM
jgi:hypothetical protein